MRKRRFGKFMDDFPCKTNRQFASNFSIDRSRGQTRNFRAVSGKAPEWFAALVLPTAKAADTPEPDRPFH